MGKRVTVKLQKRAAPIAKDEMSMADAIRSMPVAKGKEDDTCFEVSVSKRDSINAAAHTYKVTLMTRTEGGKLYVWKTSDSRQKKSKEASMH